MLGILGIDTSKAQLDSSFRCANSRKVLWNLKVDNSAVGVQQLLDRTTTEAAWVIEPTGRYSQLAVQMAYAAGRRVLLAPPKRARMFLASVQERAKTDRLDGEGLALYGLSAPLLPYPVKSEKVEQLDQWLSARRGLTQALSRLEQQQRELPYARQVLLPSIATLREQVKALDKQIASEVKRHEPFELALRLQKVPGIGAVTSTAVTSRLVSCRFEHPDKFVAYIGLDVAIKQSGNSKGNRGLTKQGDAELRRLLYLCAKASLRVKGNPFAVQYERELKKGLPKTAALCAVARKIARLCWSLWKHGSKYDPVRVGQPPTTAIRQPITAPGFTAIRPQQKEG